MELHLLRPYWLLAILPLAIIFFRLRRFKQHNNWRQVCDAHLLPHLLVENSHAKFFSPLILLGLSWLLAVIALSGPSFAKEKQNIYRLADSRMLVMSLSPSMYDNLGTTTRLMRARFKIIDLLNSMQEGQTGLVVYAGEAHTVVPLTEDNNTIKNLVPILDPSLMPVSGNDVGAALQEAEQLFDQAQISRGQIILLADKIGDTQAIEKNITALHKKNIQLYILDLSSEKKESAGLTNLARLTGGVSIKVTPNNNDIQELLKIMNSNSRMEIHEDKKLHAANFWKDEGLWFAFLIIPLALLGFRRGYLA